MIKQIDNSSLKLIAKVENEFSYIDYHADCLMKIKDDTYSTDFSLIKEVKLINNTSNSYSNLMIKFTFSHEAFNLHNILVPEINGYEELVLRIPLLKVSRPFFDLLTEKESASVMIDIIDQKNSIVLCFEEYNFVILPFFATTKNIIDDKRLYAKYVTPLDPKVKQITLNAIKYNNERPLLSYQNNGINRKNIMIEEIKSLYLALHDIGIVYQTSSSTNLYTNRIRFPKDVLKDKKGTSLDLSILFCSCLEEVGYKSILLLTSCHAFVGVFLDENLNFPNAVEYQCSKIYNASTGGMNNILLIESSTISSSSTASFKETIELGLNNLKNLKDESLIAIDVNLAHKGIFSPISINKSSEDLELLIKPKEINDEKLDSILETRYVDVLRQEEKDRFTFWERKLLDLTEANPLVNFKMGLNNSVKITSDTEIYDLLKFKEMIKLSCIVTSEKLKVSIENEFINGRTKPSDVFGEKASKEKLLVIGYEKTLKNLIKKSNSAMDETGSPTLYLCLGTLTYNRKKNNTKGLAPFMLLPIKVSKDKLGFDYTMTYDYDDIMINQTFLEYYKQEHPGFDFGDLYQINANDKYIDIVHAFKNNNTEDIMLDENVFFIANLTYAHYIMWQDVRKRKEELKKNKIIQCFLENKNILEDKVINLDTSVENLEKYNRFAAPLYYDSTQLQAILKCGEGKSFILDGPPGTGKSQTIVNMIVNAFYHGKTVLFVAEKKAALDVVADRLRKLGDINSNNNLGRFCLELHSNKANKTDFFQKLKSSMELGVTKKVDNFEEICNDLESKKQSILLAMNKMHNKKYYYSLYDSIVKYEELSKFKFYEEFDEKYLLSLTDEKILKTYNLIESYLVYATNISDYNHNPLKNLMIDDINFYDRTTVLSDFNNTKDALNEFLTSYKDMITTFNIDFEYKNDVIFKVMNTLNLCFNENLYVDTLTEFLQDLSDESMNILFDTSENLLKLKSLNNKIFNFELLDSIDAKLAITELKSAKGLFNKFKIRNKWKKVLKNVILPTHKLNKKLLINYYQQILDYNNMNNYLKNNCLILSKIINDDYMTKIDEVKTIKNSYYHTKEFINNLKDLSKNKDFMKVIETFINLYKTKNELNKMHFVTCNSKLKVFMKSEIELCNKYKILYQNYYLVNNSLDEYFELLKYASNDNNFNELIDIAKINQISSDLNKLGLNNLLKSLRLEKFDYRNFKEIYDYSVTNEIIKMYFKDEDINYFNPKLFDEEINKYKKLINEYNNLVIANVSSKLTEKLNHNNIDYANSSPIGRLKKLISNNGRGVSIRDTLLNYDDIIKKYFPCFLMSPLSAAQYLAVDNVNGKAVSKFDLVIFDEASQIPTHEAIGPIARGKSLIVAGDPEQMPPSAYFSAGLELNEDEIQYEDAISLLDECLAIDLPRIRLAYHYRSKHESLISFSNHNFYNDNLYTFPSPSTLNSFVEFNYVNLEEEKKDLGISKRELNAICDKFKEIYENDLTKDKSVGIIVFNMKQQEKVFDAIAELLLNDKKLNSNVLAAVEKTNEPWFVKSLENVQGDERDIIILSIGFRKNAAGRAVVIGPLVRENGHRRLNVAVSRSKEKMIVISTIRYTDFDEDLKIKNKGQLLLKQFLKYSEEKIFKSSINYDTKKDSIIYFIKEDIEKRGFKVASNVGNSEFMVDLAIVNKSNDLYELGILVDSKMLSKNISCRDKVYVQESVLNRLSWKIINVYSLEYFKDRKSTIDKIINALDKPYVRENSYLNANIEIEVLPKFSYNCEEYQKLNTNTYVHYDDSGYNYKIYDFLREIINTESPVSLGTIKKRLREHSNIQSISSKAKTLLYNILKKECSKITYDLYQTFYWADNMSFEISKFRTNSNRDLIDISKEEILCAMNQIYAVQGNITNEDLFRCTLEVFGETVLSKKNLEKLEYVYKWANLNNKIKK